MVWSESMGIRVELQTVTKNRLGTMLRTRPTKAGAFGKLSIEADQAMSHPARLNCDDDATLADCPDASLTHLIPPSPTGSSPRSRPSRVSATSPTHRRRCADPFDGNVYNHRRLDERSGEKDFSYISLYGEILPSTAELGRSHGCDSFKRRSSVRSEGNGVCKCAGGITTDVAVVCCCFPLSLIYLLAIAFIKLPAAVVSKTAMKIKRKVVAKRKRAALGEEDEESCPTTPSRCRSYEDRDIHNRVPDVAFGDQKLWGDCFDSPILQGFGMMGSYGKAVGDS